VATVVTTVAGYVVHQSPTNVRQRRTATTGVAAVAAVAAAVVVAVGVYTVAVDRAVHHTSRPAC